ncbi:hypothetical protein I302_108477 [Kwoniella bestiolae CBS 10118]|uniref:C2H2-type domain-containing protein n=1 Tax=Kwoniella bestiolae CBS 10118 TaxID=1296100 RepID=A0A1B9FVL2_9TREE|nr:hypothetical protein I302_07147 [Kwoniella bestiolae CBS 10118]OCF22806.1 hypothetical protein I302_07147 [Kwoniella bestiolae CBS 10118]
MLLSPRSAPLAHSLDKIPTPLVSPRTVSPVKGKSKASSPEYAPEPEDDNDEDEEFEEKPKLSRSNSRSRSTSLPACRTERRFKCLHPGCDKAYFKPSRLAEHELSHTGERPHKCPNCGQSYLRASHLHAHMRTHLSAEAKPFACEREGCGKSFWTATHLKRHYDVHDRAEVYACEQCDETFPKAHLLRDHVTLTHMPEGTKPYPCSHEGCDQSFKMKAHLKAHEKTHDPNRYTCSHPSHGTEFPSFPVWSALQTHIHTAHPPICPHLECNGRTFKNAGRLKDHLKVHAEQAVDKAALAVKQPEGETPQIIADGLSRRAKRRRISELNAGEDGGSSPKLRRVMSGEAGKDWWCEEDGCEKRFKTKFALEAHRKAIHLALRPHVCPIEGCDKSYPHRANLNRHIATHSRPTTPSGTKDDNGNNHGLVGKVKEARRFGCPAHAFARFAGMSSSGDTEAGQTAGMNADASREDDEYIPPLDDGRCLMRFWRVYDIRRHLKAEHAIELEDMEVRRLLLFDGQTGE